MKRILLLLALFCSIASMAQVQYVNGTTITGQGTQTASGNNIILATAGTGSTDVSNFKSISIQIIPTGTVSSGVVTFEASNDNTTFVALPLYDEASLTANPVSTVSPATGVNRYFLGPIYWKYVRARISTVIGGGGSLQAITTLSTNPYQPDIYTVTQATAANLNTTVTGTVTANLGTGGTGATAIGKAEDAVAASGDTGPAILGVRRDALTTSASATGDYNEIATNRFGAVLNAGFRTNARTYSATANVTVAATATDIAAIFGNATTTVQVTKIRITGIQTTAGLVDVLLIKRSTANSGGTSSNMSVAAHDAGDAANSSTPISYTANPTPGTAVGTIRRWHQAVGQSTSTVTNEFTLEFGENGKGIVLSGTAQGLCINLNSVTVTGGVFNISIEWIEF